MQSRALGGSVPKPERKETMQAWQRRFGLQKGKDRRTEESSGLGGEEEGVSCVKVARKNDGESRKRKQAIGLVWGRPRERDKETAAGVASQLEGGVIEKSGPPLRN